MIVGFIVFPEEVFGLILDNLKNNWKNNQGTEINSKYIFSAEYNNFALNEYLAFNCPFATQAEIPMFLPTSDLILTKM